MIEMMGFHYFFKKRRSVIDNAWVIICIKGEQKVECRPELNILELLERKFKWNCLETKDKFIYSTERFMLKFSTKFLHNSG